MNILINEDDNISQIYLNEELIDRIEYARIIEKLIYMMMYTRSNIAFALKKLTQFISDFFTRYNYEIKALLKYLSFNFNMLIIYREKINDVV